MKISRRFPWTLWPNSICPSFIENPALNQLKGDNYYKVDIEFEYTENNFSTMKDVFCIVPKYTGLSVFEKRIFIGIGYYDQDDWIGTDMFIEPNTREKFTYEHFPSDKLVVYRNDEVGFEYKLKERPLGVMSEPIVFIGTNRHETQDQSEDTDIIVHDFKIYGTEGLICHHDFNEIIHGKSIDKTGNLNFLYQIG